MQYVSAYDKALEDYTEVILGRWRFGLFDILTQEEVDALLNVGLSKPLPPLRDIDLDAILLLDNLAIQYLVKKHKDELPLALKGMSEELQNKFYDNMSLAAREMLKDDMALLGPVSIADAEKAHRDILETAWIQNHDALKSAGAEAWTETCCGCGSDVVDRWRKISAEISALDLNIQVSPGSRGYVCYMCLNQVFNAALNKWREVSKISPQSY